MCTNSGAHTALTQTSHKPTRICVCVCVCDCAGRSRRLRTLRALRQSVRKSVCTPHVNTRARTPIIDGVRARSPVLLTFLSSRTRRSRKALRVCGASVCVCARAICLCARIVARDRSMQVVYEYDPKSIARFVSRTQCTAIQTQTHARLNMYRYYVKYTSVVAYLVYGWYARAERPWYDECQRNVKEFQRLHQHMSRACVRVCARDTRETMCMYSERARALVG